MKISKTQIIQRNKKIIFQVNVESIKGNSILWYSLNEAHSHLVSNSSDAFLVALLIPAMELGEDIHIEGSISERLLFNLSGGFQKLLQNIIPRLNHVKIFAEDTSSRQTQPANGVATGFSGGIDSFSVLADHFYSKIPQKFRITHLLFNNVGSHGHGPGGERLFQDRYERLVPAAETIGLPF